MALGIVWIKSTVYCYLFPAGMKAIVLHHTRRLRNRIDLPSGYGPICLDLPSLTVIFAVLQKG